MKQMVFLRLSILIFFLIYSTSITSQNTLGTITYEAGIEEGYTLFTSHKQTYLINNCGQVINQWTSEFTPGNAVYLLENGDILRAGNTESDDFQFGGNGGVIERFDWDGNLQWQYFYDTTEHRQHHDIYPMPNGNVLILATTLVTEAEAIELGRDPNKLSESKLYNERVIEVKPQGSSDADIVWEWNFMDHIIQDFDNTKSNFGNVSENPQRVDINFTQTELGGARWLHINAMQYDETLDQIVLSSRHLDEFYIIDHSTTTEEAAGTSGGTYGKGGDFLYRWGNPQVYRRGTDNDRRLNGQHDTHFIAPGLEDEGKLLLFNNFFTSSPNTSAVFILDLPQTSPGFYTLEEDMPYGPTSPEYIYSNGEEFFSPIVSSAQRLPNGNMLLCEGRFGQITEIDPSDNIVWEYISPINDDTGEISSQGDDPNAILNITFRAKKYTPDYAAFDGRDLSPGDPIETNPNVSSCVTLSDEEHLLSSINVYPNPVIDYLSIKSTLPIESMEMFDIGGNKLSMNATEDTMDLSNLQAGIYLLKLSIGNKQLIKRLIKY